MNGMKHIVIILCVIILSGCGQNVIVTKVNDIDALESFSEGYSFYGIIDYSERKEAIEYPIFWGVMDENGNKITACIFSYHSKFNNGLARISIKGQSDMLIGYVDSSGEIAIEPIFTDASDFEMGLAAVREGDLYYGYINVNGEYVIDAQYYEALPFSEQLAAVDYRGKWGYIDSKGKTVIPFQYEKAQSFNSGLACVKDGGVWNMIDVNGNVVVDDVILIDNSSEKRAIIIKNDQLILIDNQGSIVKKFGDINQNKVELLVNDENLLYKSSTLAGVEVIVEGNNYYKISDGRILFKKNNTYGYLNLEDQLIKVKW